MHILRQKICGNILKDMRTFFLKARISFKTQITDFKENKKQTPESNINYLIVDVQE